jgi:hypothetical protein
LSADSTAGQPFEMPRSMSEFGSSSLCVTVSFTASSLCGSTSIVTRETFSGSAAFAGLAHVMTSRRGRSLSMTLPAMSTTPGWSVRSCSHFEPTFQSDTLRWQPQYCAAIVGSVIPSQTFSAVARM